MLQEKRLRTVCAIYNNGSRSAFRSREGRTAVLRMPPSARWWIWGQGSVQYGGGDGSGGTDTITKHFKDTGRQAKDYDLIVTGDLASVGLPIAKDLLQQNDVIMDGTVFADCGLMIYDLETQKYVNAGALAVAPAVVTYGHILKRMRKGELKRCWSLLPGLCCRLFLTSRVRAYRASLTL